MKKILLTIGMGLVMAVHCNAQEDKKEQATDGMIAGAHKDMGHKISTMPRNAGSTHPVGTHAVKPAAGKVNKSARTVQVAKPTDKTDKTKKGPRYFVPILTTPPVCVQTMFEKYSKQRLGTCSCTLPGLKLNQGLFSKIGVTEQEGSAQPNGTFKEMAEGDGSFKIGLSGRAAIKLDLGFLSGTKGKSADQSVAEDNSTELEPDLSVGVMFGLR